MQYIKATMDEPRELVAQYRANAAALRKLAGAAYRHGSTLRAFVDRTLEQGEVDSFGRLGTSQQRALVSALADERRTLLRVQEAEALGQQRPELVQRLRNNRAAIRKLIKDIEGGQR